MGFSRASALAWALARLAAAGPGGSGGGSSSTSPPPHWWAQLEASTQLPAPVAAGGAPCAHPQQQQEEQEQQEQREGHTSAHAAPPTAAAAAAAAAVRAVPMPQHGTWAPHPHAGRKSQRALGSGGPRGGIAAAAAASHAPSPGQVAVLVWAAGILSPDPRPSAPWLSALVAALGTPRALAGLAPRERAMLMAGLASLRFRPPDGWALLLLLAQTHPGDQRGGGGGGGGGSRRGAAEERSSVHESHQWAAQQQQQGQVQGQGHELGAPPGVRGAGPASPGSRAQQDGAAQPASIAGLGRGGAARRPHANPHAHAAASPPAPPDAPAGGAATARPARSGAPPVHSPLPAAEFASLLASAARLGCVLPEGAAAATADSLASRLWQMAPSQLLAVAGALQGLRHAPSRTVVVAWTEECHAQLGAFSPLQTVQLLQVLHRWHVSPGAPWVADLLRSVRPRLHAYSRTRLVELLCALARLGVRLQLGGSDGAPAGATAGSGCESGVRLQLSGGNGGDSDGSPAGAAAASGCETGARLQLGDAGSDGSDGAPAGTTAGSECETGSRLQLGDGGRDGSQASMAATVGAVRCDAVSNADGERGAAAAAVTLARVYDGARDFVADALSCFSSRHFRAPLPRHMAALAGALSCLVCCGAGENGGASAPAGANARAGSAGVQQQRRPIAGQGDRGVGPPGWGPDLAVALGRALPPEALAACLPRLGLAQRAATEAALTRLGVRLPVEGAEGVQ
ncbi:hypothetical protein FOA52_015443 [Chlamydomonas sp. UWO 241]|nr:hypothetical protein FOA52_015443 [Chlamydomonas sp. UWO 241]